MTMETTKPIFSTKSLAREVAMICPHQFVKSIWDVPGLVNVNKKRWKDPAFLMGKSTINHHFHVNVDQRVNPITSH